ncbi:hypothetical protein HBI65_118080 [Parastagonospora nodorum]|nr:hypothetical protein HBI27_191160 [Parastagonospora nodorum]KAH5989090.1 hypothetical protein HBI84_191440 [Parastagonospora nodorum]KAH6094906.1 hypothetical protein HBI65_118080 [Parastagonospora nodorum]
MAALLRFLPLEGNNIDKTNLATNESTVPCHKLQVALHELPRPSAPQAPHSPQAPSTTGKLTWNTNRDSIQTLQRQYTLDVLDLEDKASNLLRTSCTKAQNVAVNKTLQALTAQANRGIMGATVPVA